MISNTSKAKILKQLKPILRLFIVPEIVSFNAEFFIQNKLQILSKLEKIFESQLLAIRSSASDEDGQSTSSAGEYDSVLNISSNDKEKVVIAINHVISSYVRKRPLLSNDEVIVQEMVSNTTMSGVIFTHDLNTGAPYYVINYDDQSGATDTVTSGNGEYSNRTLYIHRGSANQLRSNRLIKLLQAVQELEAVMGSQFLDIEFALGADLTPYLLQVRAITTQPNWNRGITKRIDKVLQGVQLFVKDRLKEVKGVHGKTTVLGQMPDWNPVEMIGRSPRALASSFYKVLITDNAWRLAREEMGYLVPSGQPLMLSLAGQPFIDTRLSFHSYLPSTLSPIIAEKLVNHWVGQLKDSPELHDKIEFDVAITTYSFDIDEKMENLVSDVLTKREEIEFKQSHLELTMQLVCGKGSGSISQALGKIELLKNKQIEGESLPVQNNLSSLFGMVDECIQLGTVPFSILARHGFIAKTILMSLKSKGIITSDEVDKIQASVQTVASDLVDDMHSLKNGQLTKDEFMYKYGHLRPGTYDIMSYRYDQIPDLIADTSKPAPRRQMESFEFSEYQKQQINNLLSDVGFIDFDECDLLNYVNEAIIGREYGKFVFTRSVSNMLELIAIFSEKNGLSRDEISYVPLQSLLSSLKDSGESSVEEQLRKISKHEKELHGVCSAIRLPQLLFDQAGVHIIPFQVSHPNFITHKSVTSQSIVLHEGVDGISLGGKIVIIEGADPGYDWIFSQNIAGLITKYGGANSHMAIRCAEFGIPAAIGCGEQRFDQLLTANKVHLDCASGLIDLLH
jgi:glutamine kinase